MKPVLPPTHVDVAAADKLIGAVGGDRALADAAS